MLSLLVGNDIVLVEPQSNFFLGSFDRVGAVADVTANILEKLAEVESWQAYLTIQ